LETRLKRHGSPGYAIWTDVLGCGIICATLTAGWVFRGDIAEYVSPRMHEAASVAGTPHMTVQTSRLPHADTASTDAPLPTARTNPPPPTHVGPADSRIPFAPMPLPTVYRATRAGDTATAIHQANGRFVFDTQVNGTAIPMVFDTGASVVVLRAEDAGNVGIDLGTLNYSVPIRTANGTALAAPIVIAALRVGSISRTNVREVVARPGTLVVNLLGQSFLTRVAGYAMDGDRLVLRGD
jgi:clan AA aspartic protease (TIGR02281 family)